MTSSVKDLLLRLKEDHDLRRQFQEASSPKEVSEIATRAGFDLDKHDSKFMYNLDQNGSLDICSVIDFRLKVLEQADG